MFYLLFFFSWGHFRQMQGLGWRRSKSLYVLAEAEFKADCEEELTRGYLNMNLAVTLNEQFRTLITPEFTFIGDIFSCLSQRNDITPHMINIAWALVATMLPQVYGFPTVFWLMIPFLLIGVHYLYIKVVTYSIIWGLLLIRSLCRSVWHYYPFWQDSSGRAFC